jgi:hypothetical protein
MEELGPPSSTSTSVLECFFIFPSIGGVHGRSSDNRLQCIASCIDAAAACHGIQILHLNSNLEQIFFTDSFFGHKAGDGSNPDRTFYPRPSFYRHFIDSIELALHRDRLGSVISCALIN